MDDKIQPYSFKTLGALLGVIFERHKEGTSLGSMLLLDLDLCKIIATCPYLNECRAHMHLDQHLPHEE